MSTELAFKRLWTANIFTNLADGLGKTAFPLLAITLTRDPLLISIIGALDASLVAIRNSNWGHC